MSFDPEHRKNGWYATDSRRALSGKLVDVIAEKLGDKLPDDLSDIEEVQMGKKMEPFIGRLFEDETGIGVKHYNDEGVHGTEPWLKCHTDFFTADGGLLETKNFNAAIYNRYPDMDGSPMALPAMDIIQCVHEGTVFGVPHVWFCCLFGGQKLRYWKIDITNEMKNEFIQQAAKWWAMVQSKQYPAPETAEQARLIYQKSIAGTVVANERIEAACNTIKAGKAQLKAAEEELDRLTAFVQDFMGDKDTIVSVTGETLATWKSAKPSMKFSPKLLQTSMPDLYEKFIVETQGGRRFLVK